MTISRKTLAALLHDLKFREEMQRAAEAEIWKQVVENDNYEVSSLGRIRRRTQACGTQAGRILRIRVTQSGYHTTQLWRGSTYVGRFVHRLVAAAFLGPRPRGRQVNHKDANKSNNTPENLEYCTPKQNHQHAGKLGLLPHGARHWKAKVDEPIVLEIRALLQAGRSRKDVAQQFGLKLGHIHDIALRRAWKRI